MAALLGLIGWSFAGIAGVWFLALLGLAYLLLTPSLKPATLLRWMGAREFHPQQELSLVVRELAKRAGLPVAPRLFSLPHSTPNAFAMGGQEASTITVTHGLLGSLNRRQLLGVLAHEISHIAAGDLHIMGMAKAVTRLTNSMASIGMFLLLLNLPLLVLQGAGLPWLAILLLLLAPGLSLLLQFALSRRREFAADLAAAELTGDPLGLASALEELDSTARGTRLWERFFPAYRRQSTEIPEILRSHPATSERRQRLLELHRPQLTRRRVDGFGGPRWPRRSPLASEVSRLVLGHGHSIRVPG